jgi:hypothetical protein
MDAKQKYLDLKEIPGLHLPPPIGIATGLNDRSLGFGQNDVGVLPMQQGKGFLEGNDISTSVAAKRGF